MSRLAFAQLAFGAVAAAQARASEELLRQLADAVERAGATVRATR